MPCSGQQSITNPLPLLGRAISAHLHQRKHLSAFPSLFLLLFVSLCCFCKFRGLNKEEGILRQPEASCLLLKGARALTSRYYLWVEAMQIIHIWKGPQAGTSCVSDPWRQTVVGSCLEMPLGRVYFL